MVHLLVNKQVFWMYSILFMLLLLSIGLRAQPVEPVNTLQLLAVTDDQVENLAILKEGMVMDQKTGNWLYPGDIMYGGGVYTTTGEQQAAIYLGGEGLASVMMRPNTTIIINSKLKDTKKSYLTLVVGRLWATFAPNKINGFAIETYNSIASVEGTSFEMTYDPMENHTSIVVHEGVVNLLCKDNLFHSTLLNSGVQATMNENCTTRITVQQ